MQRKNILRVEKQKLDGMILDQVSEFHKQAEAKKLQNQRNLLKEKQIREFQLKEVGENKKQQKKAKRLYEKELVDNLKFQLKQDEEKKIQKKEQLKELASQMKVENENNKAMRMAAKQKAREEDVEMGRRYVELVNAQEQKKKDEFQKREDRIKEFMTRVEHGVLAEENKKQKFLEENIRKYEEKKEREDYFEDERRKKMIHERQEVLKKTLKDQMEEKNMKKKLLKETNNVYVGIFKEKVERDIEKESKEHEELKRRQREVQDTIKQQIEEKKAKAKGMTNDEFELNKDLLKKIAAETKDLRSTIKNTQTDNMYRLSGGASAPYEIYNI